MSDLGTLLNAISSASMVLRAVLVCILEAHVQCINKVWSCGFLEEIELPYDPSIVIYCVQDCAFIAAVKCLV